MPISYNDYAETYKDGKITEITFDNYTDKAIDVIRSYTFHRIPLDISKMEDAEPEVFDIIRKAIYRIANRLFDQDINIAPNGIASESTDGHSVSYITMTTEEKDKELYLLAKRCLSDTGLMYSGRNPYWDNRKW